MSATPRHVIFGTGAIGLATFDALRRRGETARLVNRSGSARVPDDVEVVGGDARDPAFTTAVADGAQVVYQTLNPPHPEWTAQFPPGAQSNLGDRLFPAALAGKTARVLGDPDPAPRRPPAERLPPPPPRRDRDSPVPRPWTPA